MAEVWMDCGCLAYHAQECYERQNYEDFLQAMLANTEQVVCGCPCHEALNLFPGDASRYESEYLEAVVKDGSYETLDTIHCDNCFHHEDLHSPQCEICACHQFKPMEVAQL